MVNHSLHGCLFDGLRLKCHRSLNHFDKVRRLALGLLHSEIVGRFSFFDFHFRPDGYHYAKGLRDCM